MADGVIDSEFPVWGLMPKKETGVITFLKKHEEYDGRNTIIAILDSGVDPAAAGLKLTSTGDTKVIERFDCSGCGDVDTSTIITKPSDGIILGLTGRKLKIPKVWKNPKDEWRVGVLYPFNLYPKKLKERVLEHRKEHLWDVHHKTAVAKASKELQDFDSENANTTNLSQEQKVWKEELEARVEVLQQIEKKYNDIGPTYDCVLFHDGDVWRACLDTSEKGDLSNGVFLGEYSVTHEHCHLTPLDEMTVSINVHDDGNMLEVVGLCSTHGTHVAAIAAGNFPDEPDSNGIAPGAKIVSLTVGDGRLGAMETGTAVVRACIKMMELSKKMKIDVANMSYGEHAHWSNTGRVGEMMLEVVNRYGVAMVVSAGNHGPALCTIGAPPDIAQPILIGVGAYVSPDMMRAAYSMRRTECGGAYSWSSRGPAADGALGVTVCAPGGAIASVARFTLRGAMLMNGTSMASPHVAGAVSILISGMKAENLPYSPYSLKRSIENSATTLSHVEPWAQGCGLLNVDRAFEVLSTYHDQIERDVTFSVQCGSDNMKGILLRPDTQDLSKDVNVTVEPSFLRDHEDMENKSLIDKQIDFKMRLTLVCNVTWVSSPVFLDLNNVSRQFTIRIDQASVPVGCNFGWICAYDTKCIEKGPVFRIPITVLKSEDLDLKILGCPVLERRGVVFQQAGIVRHFATPPRSASWAVLKLKTQDTENNGRFMIHTMQSLPKRNCKHNEHVRMYTLNPQSETVIPFKILGGVPLEVTIAKYWANSGCMTVDYSIEFHGLYSDCGRQVTLHGADGLQPIWVSSLRNEECQPSATLKYVENVLRPADSKLTPMTARDIIPPSRQIYQLILTYNFHINKATEVSPDARLISDVLYESELESQMWMIFNSNKQLLSVGDAYPHKYSVKLEKGDYCLRLNLRHDQKQLLERLQDLPVVLQQRLPQSITMELYSSYSNGITGGKKYSSTVINEKQMTPIYFGVIPADKIGRNNLSLGAILTGTMTFAKDEHGKKVDTYPLRYIIPEAPKKNNNNNKDKEKSKPADEYAEALKEFKTSWLGKLEGEKLDEIYEELKKDYPEHLGAHVAYMQSLDPPEKRLPRVGTQPDVTEETCKKIIEIADNVIKQIDKEKLLAYFGIKNDTRPNAAKIKIEQEKLRTALVDSLTRRGVAMCRLHALTSSPTTAQMQANMDDLLKFIDISESKVIQYAIWHCYTVRHHGKAIKLLNKLYEEKPAKEIDERLKELYADLGWEYYANLIDCWLPLRYPNNYLTF